MNIEQILMGQGPIVALLGFALIYLYREKVRREEQEELRHKEIEERFENLRGERESERMQLIAAQNQLVEVIKENTALIRSLKAMLQDADINIGHHS